MLELQPLDEARRTGTCAPSDPTVTSILAHPTTIGISHRSFCEQVRCHDDLA